MRVKFVGEEKYGVKPGKYDIDFRSDGNMVFCTVYELSGMLNANLVFGTMTDFLGSFVFEGAPVSRAVRKFTDFETTTYFSSGEVAEYFGVAVNTINNWVKKGKLRVHHRLDEGRGDRRFARVDCERLYEQFLEG
jgi:helix-turn-helix protein